VVTAELYHRSSPAGNSGVSLALSGHADAPSSEKKKSRCATVATEREMKVLAVLVFALLAAATVFAYGHGGVTAGVTVAASRAPRPTEPGMLLLSGSALIAAAGLVRRLRV
jgi:hypothetical protein